MVRSVVGRGPSPLVMAVMLAAGVTEPLGAQEAETGDASPPVAPPAASVEGARTYTPEDFARFSPRNALEMLRQVPGFVIREQGQERGLGEASGNVLLNGQRISGKSNDVIAELSRVPAQNVIRIEIVDGATLEIPGLSGQVANVITRATGISGQFSWSPEFRARYARPLWTRFEASVTGTEGPVEWTVGLDNQTGRGGAGGPTFIFAPDATPIEFREEVFWARSEQPRISTRLVLDGPGSSVGNLNLSFRRNFFDLEESGPRIGPGLVDRFRIVTVDEEGYSYEIGGDFDFGFGPGRLKLIGLNRASHTEPDTLVVTSFADGRADIGSRFTRLADSSERIARAEYRWNSGGTDWQISGEAAFNSLDNVSRLFLLEPDGTFDEIPLPGGTATVAEDRYEVMGSWGRPLAPNLTIQASAGGEYSQLSHIAAETTTRTFWRPKGQINAAWKPSPRTDVNLRLQRRVGQLNFGDFLAVVNLSDDRTNVGNAELVPPQSWEAEVETIRNLGIWGTTSLRIYGHLIEDIIDIIPIGLTGESPGNLDSAVRYGAEWKSTINFDPIGWRGAKLDTRLQLQESSLDDPLTGEPREISGSLQRLIDLDLRHDVPDTDWAWGASLFHHHAAFNVRLTEINRYWEGPFFASVFVEHKDVMGLTVRATLGNVLDAGSFADRTVFVGRRTGPIAFIERRERDIGPIFSFQVSGRF